MWERDVLKLAFWYLLVSGGTLLATAAVFLAVVSYPRVASAESNVNIYMGQAWNALAIIFSTGRFTRVEKHGVMRKWHPSVACFPTN